MTDIPVQPIQPEPIPPIQTPPPVQPFPEVPQTPVPSYETPSPESPQDPKKPFSWAFVIIGFLVVIIVVIAGAYYMGYLTALEDLLSQFSGSQKPASVASPVPVASVETMEASPMPISSDDSEETIQLEIQETNINGFDEDLQPIQTEIEAL